MRKLNRIAAATFAAATTLGFCAPAYANASPHATTNVVGTAGASTSASASTLTPAGLGSCSGWNNYWQFTAYCSGTGPSSYKAIALCLDYRAAYGVDRWDGDVRQSTADCSKHKGLSGDWGICLYLPNGSFNHYDRKHGADDLSDYCTAA
ncbi:hypothetical protein [Catenulispora pinisilvae]|uniref:hypothetical protein n=1 Tax=Catenulispora pinisilvae TaxID=2705253 RepID=UPI001891D855|nr:hypothetical protein [Catenulispora pinisilvae]